jgi:8-oxo-dGTP pyrophosphatase MutT (NUDIX family)
MTNKIIRPGVLIVKDNKILVLSSKYTSGEFYLLPGGRIEKDETVTECAIRETLEETNYNVKIIKLLYLQEWIDTSRNKNVMDMIFLANILDGEETHLNDPCLEKGHIKCIEWKTVDELKQEKFFPKGILEILERDMTENFPRDGMYLPPDLNR